MLSVLFAGLWPMLWHLSGAGLIIAVCLGVAWFLPPLRSIALWCALAVFATTSAYIVGVKDGEHRVQAQWDATIARDKAAAEKAARDADNLCDTPNCLRDDPNNRNR